MNRNNKIKLFLVDDDPLYLKLLEIEFLQYPKFTLEMCASGEECIKKLSLEPDIIILDYNLSGLDRNAINGIQTLDKIKAINPGIEVVMLSSQDAIEVAINCMHHKASDYIVKSETAFMRLQKILATILNTRNLERALEWYMERM
jgi:two-component system, OmpR family, response regulator